MTPARATEAVALSAKRNFMVGVQPTKKSKSEKKEREKKKIGIRKGSRQAEASGFVGCQVQAQGLGPG
jgi:hypothetical protein